MELWEALTLIVLAIIGIAFLIDNVRVLRRLREIQDIMREWSDD
jgi:hypothetical protein